MTLQRIKNWLAFPFMFIGGCYLFIAFSIAGKENEKFIHFIMEYPNK